MQIKAVASAEGHSALFRTKRRSALREGGRSGAGGGGVEAPRRARGRGGGARRARGAGAAARRGAHMHKDSKWGAHGAGGAAHARGQDQNCALLFHADLRKSETAQIISGAAGQPPLGRDTADFGPLFRLTHRGQTNFAIQRRRTLHESTFHVATWARHDVTWAPLSLHSLGW